MRAVGVLAALVALLSTFAEASTAECYIPTQREDCEYNACVNNTCVPCKEDSQCFFAMNKCSKTNTPSECVIKTFADLTIGHEAAVLAVLFVWAIAQAIAGGGIGTTTAGAALFLGLPFPGAVIASLCFNVGAALVRVPYAVWRNHPTVQPGEPTRPVINYQVLAFIGPMTFLGTVYGRFIGLRMYELHRVIFLLIVEGVSIPLLMQNAWLRSKREEKMRRRKALGLEDPLPNDENRSLTSLPPTMNKQPLRESLPTIPVLELCVIFAGQALSVLYRQGLKLGTDMSIQIASLLLATITMTAMMLWYRQRLLRGSDGVEGYPSVSFPWTYRSSIMTPVLGIIVGIASSVTSSGAIAVLLLLMKLHPDESIETTRLLNALTIIIPVVSHFTSGEPYYMDWTWAVVFAVTGTLGAVISVFITELLRKYNAFAVLPAMKGMTKLLTLILTITMIIVVSLTNEKYGVPASR